TVVSMIRPEQGQGAAMAWQQGRMRVDGTEWRQVNDVLMNPARVSGNADEIGPYRAQAVCDHRLVEIGCKNNGNSLRASSTLQLRQAVYPGDAQPRVPPRQIRL